MLDTIVRDRRWVIERLNDNRKQLYEINDRQELTRPILNAYMQMEYQGKCYLEAEQQAKQQLEGFCMLLNEFKKKITEENKEEHRPELDKDMYEYGTPDQIREYRVQRGIEGKQI